jgi:hypothetical protein
MSEVQTRALAMQYQNRFWAEYGGNSDTAGFVSMLEQLDKELPSKSELRMNPAFEWLQRLRALKNIHVIQSGQAAGGGDHDFSEYGVRNAYEAGRSAVASYFAQRQEKQPRLHTSKELDAA